MTITFKYAFTMFILIFISVAYPAGRNSDNFVCTVEHNENSVSQGKSLFKPEYINCPHAFIISNCSLKQ